MGNKKANSIWDPDNQRNRMLGYDADDDRCVFYCTVKDQRINELTETALALWRDIFATNMNGVGLDVTPMISAGGVRLHMTTMKTTSIVQSVVV